MDKEQKHIVIKVAVVDDDDEIRNGLEWILNRCDGYQCSGIYRNYEEALRGFKEATPDVVLMDIAMPGKSGIECVEELKKHFPTVQFVMQTVYADDEKIFESLRAGAVGYILKKTQSAKILQAISDAYDGGAPMSGEIARKVLLYFQSQQKKVSSEKFAELSEREIEVLKELIEGHSYKTIAEKLFVSVHTIRFHLHNIYEKLHVSSRSEAVAKAMKHKSFLGIYENYQSDNR